MKSKIDKFIDLSDSQKERILKQIESETPQQRLKKSRPLNVKERKQWKRFKAKLGRPAVGLGAKTISLTVERQLLEKADAYAKQHGISRAKLVAKGIQKIIGAAA